MPEEVNLSNREAEQSVLGSVFFEEKSIQLLIDKILVEDFYYLRHQLIYQTMIDLFNMHSPIDSTTVVSNLSDKGRLADCGGAEYVFDLVDAVPTTSNLDTYINIVKDKAIQRKVVAACNSIISDSKKDISNSKQFLDDVEKKIFEATRDRLAGDVIKVNRVLDRARAKIEENARLQKGDVTGINTGYESLNNFTLGFQKSELIILAARPSVGKTALALNIATNVALLPEHPSVVFFSLEMSVDQLALRLLSSQAMINQRTLKSGQNLPKHFWPALNTAQDQLRDASLYFDDSGASTIQDVRSICRKKKHENQLDLIIVDYLQLLSTTSKRESRVQEVSEISRALKEMARELNVPVLALSQVSRSIESRQDKTPNMADLRESGSIEQDADVVIFISREDVYKKANEPKDNLAKIIISKNRNGITGDFDLWFEASNTKFIELSEAKGAENDY